MVTKGSTIEQVLDALGDPTRRQILALLRAGPRAVGEIAAELPVSRPAVSKHLRQLEAAGLVEHSESGTRNIFQLRRAGFEVARGYVESFWDEALEQFRRLAEADEGAAGGA